MRLKLLMVCLTSVLSAGALAENLDPKTDLEYAQVMMECYTENLPANERWEVLKFTYVRDKTDKEGKRKLTYQPNTVLTIDPGKMHHPAIRSLQS